MFILKTRPLKKILLLLGTSLCLSPNIYAQHRLVSPVDQDLSLNRIFIAPILDNTDGIYSRPLTDHLQKIVNDDRQLDLSGYQSSRLYSLEEYESDPNYVLDLFKSAQVEGLITGRILKGTHGISIRLGLFVGASGELFIEEKLDNYSGFEINDVKSQLEKLYYQMKNRMPYGGVILSRSGQLVTLNLGQLQGAQVGEIVDAVQIIRIQRHPKFKFMISADREILGKVRITKAEDYLSFGEILMERDPQLLQAGTKILPLSFVHYPSLPRTADGKTHPEINTRPDSQVMGGGMSEWTPKPTPTFGKVSLLVGLGSQTLNNTLVTSGSVESKSSFTPSVNFGAELWLTARWFTSLDLRQFIFSAKNGLNGSSPDKLSASVSQYTLQFGYNILIEERFNGPKFQILAGYSDVNAKIDGSTPTAHTSLNFSGLALGFGGYFPLDDPQYPYGFGANFNYYINANSSESPVSSGASSSTKMSSLTLYGDYRLSPSLKLRADLIYDAYNIDFSGAGTRPERATSAGLSATTLAAGIEYHF